MRFLVNSIIKSFHNWNFQKVDSHLSSSLYCYVDVFDKSRMDIGDDYILCSDEYRNENYEETRGRKQLTCRVTFSNLDDLNEEEQKELNEECGVGFLHEYEFGIYITLRGDVFREVLNEINFGKTICQLSVSFKKYHDEDSFGYGSEMDGSHTVWKIGKEENNRLIVDSYNISFNVYERQEEISYEEKERERNLKQSLLKSTIEESIINSSHLFKKQDYSKYFLEIKRTLFIIGILLGIIILRLIF